ncbi:acyl-CoA dehydrogenase [Legionella shakespearei]|uniref:Isovaleryl CoA dehydrogenase n=1 Tax=Legionella shakespearei DSM 23087 TaxID=1122169 RepID=A0A0W0YZL9_9GAMM|nr:acyl-CoA dehydrogenase [Legionella shakespearei]KTD62306.1 isovaleryl CoA dehydrogenase [Legionella shakespearei DSM 23087]
MSSSNEMVQFMESFERYLGNPQSSDTPLNFKHILTHDEQEEVSGELIAFVQQWGFMDYIIPRHVGGKMGSFDQLYHLSKILARRDTTVANTLGLALFGALPTWIAGTLEQKKSLAVLLRKGAILALALTEEEHGSDLTANEMMATQVEDGWEISGRKWCVNFATKGEGVTVLCRTHEKGGLLGFSLFFIDKSLVKNGITYLPKMPTLGVRGLDISGFTFDKVQVSSEALIGKEKQGLEITYKVFQISRTLCACLSVGGADTALRMALSFSLERQLYGSPAYVIPAVKQRLGEQFTQLLIADCISLVVLRACTILPDKMSFWSAIIKFLVPRMCEDIVEQSAIILGARGFLRTTPWAMMQKIRRDIQVVGLFDGSSQVNLSLIAGNLLPQSRMRGTHVVDDGSSLKQLFQVDSTCPEFKEDEMGMFTHSEDDVFAGLMRLQCDPIQHLITATREEIIRLDEQVRQLKEDKQFDPRGLAAFRLAEHYCWIFAASCCLQYWYYNQNSLPEELKDTTWVTLAIQFILNKLNSTRPVDAALQETMAERLCSFYNNNKLFAVISAQLAE